MNDLVKILGAAIFFVILSAGSAASDEIDMNLDKASTFLETGKPDSAAVLLYDLVDSITDPGYRVRALYYLSEAVSQLGRFDEKKHYLSLAIELDPEVEYADKARFSYCRILLESGEIDDFINLSSEFIQLYSDSLLIPDILYMSGNAYMKKGEYQRSFNIFNDIIKKHQSSNAARESILKAGICLFNLGFLDGSIKNLEKYLVEIPDGQNVDEALYFLGHTYERIQQPVLAANAYKRLTIEFPSYPEIMNTYFRLGKNMFEAGQFYEAENAFLNYTANTVQTNENYDEALYFLERINFKTGKYYSEIQIVENFTSKYPESPRTPMLLFDIARYYRMAGQTTKAIEYYRVFLNSELYTDFADSAAILLADTHVAANQNDRATAFLLEWARQRENTVTAQAMFLKLGSLYETWELYDVAITWYDSSLTVNFSPEISVQALWGMGRSLVEVNRWRDAEKTYKRIISEYPENPYMLDICLALSDLFYHQGRIEDSIHASENALKYARSPMKADILHFVAELYEEIDEDHALQLYSMIFNDDSNAIEKRTEARLKFANLAWRKGDRISAVKAYAKIINEAADSSSVNKARQQLNIINTDTDISKE